MKAVGSCCNQSPPTWQSLGFSDRGSPSSRERVNMSGDPVVLASFFSSKPQPYPTPKTDSKGRHVNCRVKLWWLQRGGPGPYKVGVRRP